MSCRLPIQPARGTLAALQAKVAELQPNELVFATDTEQLYIVKNGALVALTDDVALGDVVIALTTRVTNLETALTQFLDSGPIIIE